MRFFLMLNRCQLLGNFLLLLFQKVKGNCIVIVGF